MAGAVAVQRQAQLSPAPGVAHHLHGVAAHGSNRRKTGEDGRFLPAFRRVKTALHALDIAHGTADVLGRHFQPESIPRLQQLAFGHHQALPHSAVGRLPEVAALGVLEVCSARDEGDLHIGQRRTGQHAEMLFFLQMGQHKALPVLVQHLFPAVGGKLHPAAAGQRFQLQMHLGIMAQRLVVAHALHGFGDGLLVQDAAGAELHVQAEPLCQQAAQHFQLHFAHELDMNLAQCFVPHHMELRFLFFQTVQLAQRGMDVGPLRQQHLIAQHRFQHRHIAVPLRAKAFARAGFGQAGDRAHLPRGDGLGQRIFCAGIQPQLIGLFRPRLAVGLAGELGFHLQFSTCHPQPCQAGALLVLRNLEHLGPERFQRRSRTGEAVQPGQKCVHAVHFVRFGAAQRMAEPARENMPPGNGRDDVRIGQRSGIQHPFHQGFVAHCQCFIPVGLYCAEIHKALAKATVQLGQQLFPALSGQVHLVHEYKGWHMVAPQQPPERLGVALHTVGAADHQHRIIQHLQSALGLGRKIHMARGVQQGDIGIARRQQGLL